MADGSKIEWTDATWSPITGCSVVSPGCTNCYAMKLAGGRLRNHPSRAGLTEPSKAGPVWNGQVRFNEEWLDQPLRWRKPRRVFVCAHGDLFHEAAADEWIDRVFAVMALAPRHIFQVLTKRPERMRDYLESRSRSNEFWEVQARKLGWTLKFKYGGKEFGLCKFPLPNVWAGVSVEDQARANERIRWLLETPAAVRFISAEPLLGPIDLSPLRCPDFKYGEGSASIYALRGENGYQVPTSHWVEDFAKLDWVIVGGESGPGARPMHPDWARSIREQCNRNEIPLFFKQWGEWRWIENMDFEEAAWWAGSLKYEHHSCGRTAVRVGKKQAGRDLDGRTWDEMPA